MCVCGACEEKICAALLLLIPGTHQPPWHALHSTSHTRVLRTRALCLLALAGRRERVDCVCVCTVPPRTARAFSSGAALVLCDDVWLRNAIHACAS